MKNTWNRKTILISDSLNLGLQQAKIKYLIEEKEHKYKLHLDSLETEQQKVLTEIKRKKQAKESYIIKVFSFIFLLFLVVVFYLIYRRKKLATTYKLIQLEHKLLRTQMNPHFIFNSLTTIGSYVLTNNAQLSYNYITKFAKLMRLTLDSSRKETIPLSSEIQILENFLLLHQLNNKEKLNYSLNYPKELLDEDLFIPPMLLQPFIENSIEHGLNNKTNSITISIDFELKEHVLICKVKDNGMGFTKSKNTKKHESHALKITKERIKNIKKQSNKTVKIIVTDNNNKANTKENGVLVELQIEV